MQPALTMLCIPRREGGVVQVGVSMAAAGFSDRVIAMDLAVSAPQVRRSVARFVKPRVSIRDPLYYSGEAVVVGSGWATRRLFAALQHGVAKKNNAVDRPNPANHRPQGVMQRVPNGNSGLNGDFVDCGRMPLVAGVIAW